MPVFEGSHNRHRARTGQRSGSHAPPGLRRSRQPPQRGQQAQALAIDAAPPRSPSEAWHQDRRVRTPGSSCAQALQPPCPRQPCCGRRLRHEATMHAPPRRSHDRLPAPPAKQPRHAQPAPFRSRHRPRVKTPVPRLRHHRDRRHSRRGRRSRVRDPWSSQRGAPWQSGPDSPAG